MKVSIIVPIYNVALYIEKCLRSVFDQTYQDIELILINDCSPDNSMEIVHDFLQKNLTTREVKIVEMPQNGGLSAVRNVGISHASGEYLYFLDSDDSLPINSIATLATLAIKYNPDFVIGGVEVIGNFDPIVSFGKEDFINANADILDLYLRRGWYVMAWNKMIKTKFVKEHHLFFYEGIYHEDELWSFNLALNAHSMALSPEKTYNYYIRGDSITGVMKKKNVEDHAIVYCEMLRLVKTNPSLLKDDLMISFLNDYKFIILTLPFIKSLSFSKKEWLSIYNKLEKVNDVRSPFLSRKGNFLSKVKELLIIFPSYYYLLYKFVYWIRSKR